MINWTLINFQINFRDVVRTTIAFALITSLLTSTPALSEDLIPAAALIDILGNRETNQQQNQYKATRSIDLNRGIAGVRPGKDNTAVADKSDSTAPQHSFNNILFSSNSATLRNESFRQLDEIGKALQQLMADDYTAAFVIVGHTDNRGTQSHNLQLSLRRAQAVKAYLVDKFNIQISRLDSKGLGELQPITDNTTASKRQLNRRVVLQRHHSQ